MYVLIRNGSSILNSGFNDHFRPAIGITYPGEVEILGAEEIVFDYTTDACDVEDIPDVPAQAFRDVDNNIQLIASHMISYRMIGSDFSTLSRDCANGPVFESGSATEANTYDNDEWLAGVYSPDGATVYSIVHNEYKPNGTADWEHSWYNTLTFATSTDTGRTYTQAASPDHFLAGIPYQYQYGAPMGVFGGSSPVYNSADGYYYAMVHLESYELQEWGAGVMRTQTLSDVNSWRGWDGTGFNVSFVDPYNETVGEPADHIMAPVSRDNIGKMSASLTYNTFFERFMVVDFFNKYDGAQNRMVYGLYYSLSEDLVNWSSAILIKESDVEGWGVGGIYYPAIIDHDDTSRNFEEPDQEAYVYYTRWNSGTYDRDLCRTPIRFTKNIVSSFTVNSIGDDEAYNIGTGLAYTGNVNTEGDPEVTLRSALLEALACPDSTAILPINFNIPGDGPHVIAINAFLPSLSRPIVIDGYSQPGASANTLGFEEGNNAVIKIELDGSATGGAVGLTITGTNSSISGLAMHSFGSGFAFEEASSSSVEGCLLGFDASGSAVSDAIGIEIWKSADITIGGTLGASQNIIRGQVEIDQALSMNNEVVGNYIGTDVSGSSASGNGTVHISNGANNNLINNNLISGTYRGVDINSGAHNNTVTNNLMGTDKTGSSALYSGLTGVVIFDGAYDNVIGTPGNGNIISGWSTGGVSVMSATSTGNIFQANYVGTNAGGDDLGNGYPSGITLSDGANTTTIGGTNSNEANVIAYNSGTGIVLSSNAGIGNAILGNSIYSNEFGIDLGDDGITANDDNDADSGPNNYQNAPVLSSVELTTNQTTIDGSISSFPSTAYRIEFFLNEFAPNGNREGETFISSVDVTSDVDGYSAFQLVLDYELTPGYYVTSTATDENNNTSEFSAAEQATGLGYAPTISATPTELSFDLNPTQMLSEDISIGNAGTIDLVYIATTDAPWVRLTNEEASVGPGGTALLNVTVDPSGMMSGSHSGTVFISSNDPAASLVEVPVTMTVNGSASIEVLPAELVVEMQSGGDGVDTLYISNVGTTLMEYYLHTSDDFLVVTPDWGSVQASETDTVVVSVAAGSVASGIYYGWIQVDHNDPDNQSITVDIEVWVSMEGPMFFANQDAFDLVVPQQSTYYDTLIISNPGTETMDWSGECTFSRVTLSPSSGSIVAGAADTVEIEINAIGIGTGTYPHSLNFTTNDPGQPSPSIPFNVEITSPNPVMGLSQSVFELDVPGGSVADDTLVITNTGDSNLEWSASDAFDWLTIVPISGFVVPGDSALVTITFNAIGVGSGVYGGSFTVSSNDPDNSSATIPVQMTVGSDAEISISVDTLSVSMDLGQSNASAEFMISNIGTSNLECTLAAGDSSPWININPASPDNIEPNGVQIITVNIDGTSLAEGVHEGAVIISSNDSDESELSIPVIVDVGTNTAPAELRINSPDNGTVINADSVIVTYTVNNFLVDFVPNGDGYIQFQLDDQSIGNRFSIIPLTLQNLSEGDHELRMWLVNNDGDFVEPNVADTVFFTVEMLSPVISVEPDTLSFVQEIGTSVSDTIMLFNTGFAELEWMAQNSIPWLSLDNNGGTLEAHMQMPIIATVNTEGLIEGDYVEHVEVTSNDPDTPGVNIVIKLIVFGIPEMSVDVSNLTCTVPEDSSIIDTISIACNGTGVLTWKITNQTDWLSYDVNMGDISSGDNYDLVLNVSAEDLVPATYLDTLVFTSNDQANPVITIPVELVVLPLVGIDNPSQAPSMFALNQNYPNPFNPTTTFSYDVPEQVNIKLTIYDIHGKVIRNVSSGVVSVGHYQYIWNGMNESGEIVSTGVYLARMQAGSYSKTIKMLYLK